MPTQVSCHSLSGFKDLAPTARHAVISIRDDGQTNVDLRGWGPSLVCLFTDVEYDEEFVDRWGWAWVRDSGLFAPPEASRIRQFLQTPEVLACDELVIHCYGGESRSVAVGKYAAERFEVPLVLTRRERPNKTVLQLLHDPFALGNPQALARIRTQQDDFVSKAVRFLRELVGARRT